jgi:DNA processing protein
VTEREAFVALNLVPGMGPITVARLIEALGSAEAVGRASLADLRAVRGVGPERAEQVRRAWETVDPRAEMARAAELRVELVTWVDPAYPAVLKAIPDPPLVLYVRGSPAALAGPAVAVVGTRHPTLYGRETSRRLAYQLAGAGFVVVSGLARGIDTEAHRGALQAKGRTVAVLGGALDCLYPEENEELAGEMAAAGGAVVSEFPFGRQPDRQTFPMRNRVVSGLCKGVVVVEAPSNSGTLITADQALEQGRAVMAVPGRTDSPASQGCHRLIRAGARLVCDAEHVLEEMGALLPTEPMPVGPARGTAAGGPAADAAAPRPVVGADEQRLLAAVPAGEEVHVDALIRATELPAGTVNALLVGLQIKRRVRLLPGGMVARVA